MNKFEKYYKAVEYIEGLPSIQNGCFLPGRNANPQHYLKRTRWFLDKLGNPDRGIDFIHVTGTSGKGSVSKMLSEILSASGKKTGLFTSPFSTTSIEKISVDGLYIGTNNFVKIVQELKPAIEDAKENCPWGIPTYFEIFMAIAFIYFKKEKCQWVVLEVGCGGRFDATNVIEKKEVAVITNISLDHTHIIGDTLEKIAYEKAGIIKNGCTFFTTEDNPEILKMFSQICKENQIREVYVDDELESVEYLNDSMILKIRGFDKTIKMKLWGAYQIKNVLLVISIAKHLGISKDSILRGLEKANMPCRFELIQKSPRIILDGAHNPAKMLSTISNLEKMTFDRLFLVLGAGNKNETDEMLSLIVSKADQVIFTTFNFGKPFSALELSSRCQKWLKTGAVCESEEDMQKALEKAINIASKDDLILVTGSFYLSGELRKKWFTEEKILRKRGSF